VDKYIDPKWTKFFREGYKRLTHIKKKITSQ